MTFWFLWTSPAFFCCPRLHPVVTVRSESPPSHPQSLQLSDLIVLLIQLLKQRHRVTEQPILSKTQPRTARNHLTRVSTRRMKFLPHEHVLHALPRAVSISHAPGHTSSTCLLHLTYCHVRPRMTSHYHVIR